MKRDLFKKVRIGQKNPKWEKCISRLHDIYNRKDDIRSPFARDYNRILHCPAYRRLKHKTQVFYAPSNDHICTRMEHVNHVNAVSYTIAKYLGLNIELIDAISVGHDLGHAPFGHSGEKFLSKISEKEIGEQFWHEKNSLRFVDDIETLEDPNGNRRNLNLTYAVRDGIVCHCGEVYENSIFPRDEFIDLNFIMEPNQYKPFTWEGCVVKIADKIAFLGRDIEDALNLKILTPSQVKELFKIVRPYSKSKIHKLNNTVIIHVFIIDLCANSTPDDGIKFSEKILDFMTLLTKFCYENIYSHKRLNNYEKYAELIINSIYDVLKGYYSKEKTIDEVKRHSFLYPNLANIFSDWLLRYAYPNKRSKIFKNKILYDLNKEKEYFKAILDFIAGMIDIFAITIFNEVTMF